jgi:hypothetical protein
VPVRWTRIVLRLRVLVLAVWAAVLVAGAVASMHLTPLLSNSFDVPGTSSERARALLSDRFGERPDGTFTVVVRSGVPEARFRARVEQAAAAIPGARVGLVRRGGGILFVDVTTPFDLQHAKGRTDAIRRTPTSRASPRSSATSTPSSPPTSAVARRSRCR